MNFKKYLIINNYKNYIQNIFLNIIFYFDISINKTVHVNGTKIVFITKSKKEYFLRTEIAFNSEKTTMEWINNFIKPGETVYDIGSNVGSYSLLIGLKFSNTNNKVYSFEPHFKNFYSLNSNILQNKLKGVVIPISTPIGEKQNFENFILGDLESGSAESSLSKQMQLNAPHIQGVITISLDEFVKLDNVKKAWNDHSVPIKKFGRYPHRNIILNRKSTSEEEEFLKKPNSSW